MRCPSCNTKMEREDSLELINEKLVPAALYACGGCGGEFVWVRLRGLKRISESTEDLCGIIRKFARTQ